MKHLHIITNDKFTDDFILFIKNNFNFKEHFFIIIGDRINRSKDEISTLKGKNIYKINTLRKIKNLLYIEKKLYKPRKIHFHGFFNGDVIKLLFIQPWLLKKSNWIIWGGDLYSYKRPKDGWKKKISEITKKYVIKNISEITSFIPGDYEIAKNIYNTKATYHNALSYNVFVDSDYFDELVNNNEKKDDVIRIQVGNSAAPSNNHQEILEKLSKFRDEKIEIVVPLSYGDIEHKNKIIESGYDLFGNKFNPLTDFYKIRDYLKILNTIDVGIFNHKRQQGNGNITKLLRLGKKVYLRSDVTTWDYFKDIGAIVFDSKQIENEDFNSLVKIDNQISRQNIKAIKHIRSKSQRVKQWEKILRY